MSKNGAIIRFDIKTFLKMIDFEGGTIHNIKLNDKYLIPNCIEILLEHNDLPKVEMGDVVMDITPIYQSTYGDNGCLIRVERTYPSKKDSK